MCGLVAGGEMGEKKRAANGRPHRLLRKRFSDLIRASLGLPSSVSRLRGTREPPSPRERLRETDCHTSVRYIKV